MDLDDLGLDGPSKVPSRVSRFAPGRAAMPKAKPKQEQQESVPKQEGKQIEKESEVEAKVSQLPVSIGLPQTDSSIVDDIDALKVDIETKMEAKKELVCDDPMDEVQHEQLGQEDQPVEEDIVVREIDVFFNPPDNEDNRLYLIQYPLRPRWRPYELDEHCEEVRVKHAKPEMEIDLSLDVNSKNYDSDFGRKLNMTKQTLTTTWEIPHSTNLAVGVLVGDKLHLNPIHTVVQLRPSMEHLNAVGKRKNTAVASAEGGVKLEEPNDQKSVSAAKKQKESSTEPSTEDAESWIPLKYHGPHSDLSSTCMKRMMTRESSPIHFNMSPSDYLDSICPRGSNKNDKPRGTSRRILLSMALEERFQKLLCEGPPLQRFSTLKHFAPDDSIEDVFRVLQQHALLVQGLWTPKTRLLNLDPALSLLRDYALVLFSKDLKIRFSQLDELENRKVRMNDILNTLAIERHSLEYWKLKEPPDVAFMKQYPEIVKKQEPVLKTMEDRVFSAIRGSKGGAANRKNIRGSKLAISGKPESCVDSDRGATKSLSGGRTKRTMSDETRKALPKALTKVFQNHKVCSFQQICQGLRDLAVSKATIPKADSSMEVVAAYGVDAPQEELQEVISQVATNIHGYYVLKSSPEHPLLDPLRKVVIDLLCVKGPDAKLKKADIFTAAKIALNRDITSADYNKVMTDFCESRGSAWVLKRGDVIPK